LIVTISSQGLQTVSEKVWLCHVLWLCHKLCTDTF